jgi:hypothetical protein
MRHFASDHHRLNAEWSDHLRKKFLVTLMIARGRPDAISNHEALPQKKPNVPDERHAADNQFQAPYFLHPLYPAVMQPLCRHFSLREDKLS